MGGANGWWENDRTSGLEILLSLKKYILYEIIYIHIYIYILLYYEKYIIWNSIYTHMLYKIVDLAFPGNIPYLLCNSHLLVINVMHISLGRESLQTPQLSPLYLPAGLAPYIHRHIYNILWVPSYCPDKLFKILPQGQTLYFCTDWNPMNDLPLFPSLLQHEVFLIT